MSVIFGTKNVKKKKNKGIQLYRFCSQCRTTRNLEEYQWAKYATIFFIPLFKISAGESVLSCSTCGTSFVVQPDDYVDGSRQSYSDHSDKKIIIECVNCRRHLRLPDVQKALLVTCPLCKHKFVVDHGKIQSSTAENSLYKKPFFSRKSYAFIGTSLIAGLLILLVVLYPSSQKKQQQVYPRPEQTKSDVASVPEKIPHEAPSPPARALPKNGTIFRYTSDDCLAPLKVNTSPGCNYFIKVVDYNTGTPIASMFIRSGKIGNMTLPLGSFAIKYATGNNWYGETHLFGPDTSFFKCDHKFDFRSDGTGFHGYRVELIKQVGGNLSTRIISKNEF